MCDKRLIKTRKTDRRRTNTEAERYVFQTGKPTSPLSIIVLHWRIIPRQTCWALNFESVLLTLITFLARDGNQRRQTANQSSSIDRILIPTQRRIRDLPPPATPGSARQWHVRRVRTLSARPKNGIKSLLLFPTTFQTPSESVDLVYWFYHYDVFIIYFFPFHTQRPFFYFFSNKSLFQPDSR